MTFEDMDLAIKIVKGAAPRRRSGTRSAVESPERHANSRKARRCARMRAARANLLIKKQAAAAAEKQAAEAAKKAAAAEAKKAADQKKALKELGLDAETLGLAPSKAKVNKGPVKPKEFKNVSPATRI